MSITHNIENARKNGTFGVCKPLFQSFDKFVYFAQNTINCGLIF